MSRGTGSAPETTAARVAEEPAEALSRQPVRLLPREEVAREPVAPAAEREPLQRKRPPEPEKRLPRRRAKPTALAEEPPELSGGGTTPTVELG